MVTTCAVGLSVKVGWTIWISYFSSFFSQLMCAVETYLEVKELRVLFKRINLGRPRAIKCLRTCITKRPACTTYTYILVVVTAEKTQKPKVPIYYRKRLFSITIFSSCPLHKRERERERETNDNAKHNTVGFSSYYSYRLPCINSED
jgi:hypothetical protein